MREKTVYLTFLGRRYRVVSISLNGFVREITNRRKCLTQMCIHSNVPNPYIALFWLCSQNLVFMLWISCFKLHNSWVFNQSLDSWFSWQIFYFLFKSPKIIYYRYCRKKTVFGAAASNYLVNIYSTINLKETLTRNTFFVETADVTKIVPLLLLQKDYFTAYC